MAGLGVILGLFLLFLVIGSILGWTATGKLSRLQAALNEIERRQRELERRLQVAGEPHARREPRETVAAAPKATPSPEQTAQATTEHSPTERRPEAQPAPQSRPHPEPVRRTVPVTPNWERAAPEPREPGFFDSLLENMRDNWMAWLGGVCVALAGIFLVGYGIEMGYLGPRARIVAAVLGGIALHAAAEYFRRKTGQAHPAFAAMAGGASITLYAAFYAALELYQLLSPGTTFTLLAILSIGTLALTTVHGPLLAAIGILGAYFVPLLVPGYGGSALTDLGYSLIVTTAALFLIRFVYRPWLWYGMLAGALGWWLVSLGQDEADGFRGYYLAALAYLALAVPVSDWLLHRRPQASDPAAEDLTRAGFTAPTILITIMLIALAQAASIAHFGFTNLPQSLLLWSPLTIVVFRALRARDSLSVAPWFLLLTQLGAWIVSWETNTPADPYRSFLPFTFAMGLLFSLGGWLACRKRAYSHLSASQIWLAPVLWIALAYHLVAELSQSWQWAAATLSLGLIYIALAGRRLERRNDDASAIWLLLGGHLAYSLAAAMLFREATLTLALAAQLISLAWLHRRFSLPALQWLIKGVLALVVARLTLNPWLATYPSDLHWSLWTYGGATACCFVASRLADETLGIRAWLEAASLHLLVLFLGAETRYWLYDGRIFIDEISLTESAIDAVLWGGLGLTYFNRARHSRHLAQLYTICSRILLVLALGAYALSLTALNPLFGNEPITSTKIWNVLLLAYGAPVVVAIAAWFYYYSRFRDLAAAIAAAGVFVFVSLEIRHLWQGALDLDLTTSNGEFYTYSAVWLVMAIATMLTATRFGSRRGYSAGTGLLFLVIGKIFIFDMAGLEGLLRVASFLGLGLALLGLAWLYRRTAKEIA